ncbi:MAG: hypothetical protein ACXVEF_26720 [Polyangiales bacterium]
MRLALLLAIVCAAPVPLAVVASCRRSSSPSPPSGDVGVSASPSPSATLPAPPPTIGLAAMPSSPTKEALDANSEGFKAHKKGDYAASRALFEKALAASPDFALARFNRACALSRLGELAAAATDLRALLEADLRRFAPMLRGDPDLEPLRTSAEGRALDAHVKLLESLWAEARTRGVVAFLWRRVAYTRVTMDGTDWLAPSVLRPGVYLQESKRFVPMTREIEGARAAVVDDTRTSAVFLTSLASTSLGCGVVCPGEVDRKVRIASFDGRDDGAAKWIAAPVMEGWNGLELVLRPMPFGALAREEPSVGSMPWHRFSIEGESIESAPVSAGPRWAYNYRGLQRLFPRTASGISATAKELTTKAGTHVALEKEHQFLKIPPTRDGERPFPQRSVLASPDGRLVVVVSNIDQCRCFLDEKNPGPSEVLAHAVSLVEPSSGRSWLLDAGDGMGDALFDASGALYVQTGETLKTWSLATGAADPVSEPVMSGVLLATPTGIRHSCCSA